MASRLLTAAVVLAASFAAVPVPAAAQAPPPPRLIVAISVDQFSADLFAEYRRHVTGGLKRLQDGAVFPSGYQSHAATETCPGHSTILTGVRPARTGIVANSWSVRTPSGGIRHVNCVEDENQPARSSRDYPVGIGHLLVPTLGDRLKAANPAARNVAVAGKDRSALMMGGHALDQVYWWGGTGFTTLPGRELGPSAVAQNAAAATELARAAAPLPVPPVCAARDRAVAAGGGSVGTGRFARAAGDENRFRASPELDAATVALAERLVAELDLGGDSVTDVLSVGLSATDLIGHATGSEGLEMCLQLHALDRLLGGLFAGLDRRGIDYLVVLTADHGGFDLPERLNQQALGQAQRVDPELAPARLAPAVAERLGIALPRPLFVAEGPAGGVYLDAALTAEQRVRVLTELKAIERHPQVAAVFTAEELARAPRPSGSPETWTLLQRAAASYHAGRSGDALILLERGVVPFAARPGLVTTHGSPWDHDRRVPILFWRRGIAPFEQPHPVETVDIAPTLAAVLGIAVPAGAFDGRCLDLDAAAGDSCAGR